MPGGRGNTEIVEVMRAQPINNGAQNLFGGQTFPLGEGWLRMILRFNHSLTHGTGSSATSEGELLITKAISLRSDKNEFFYKNVAGRSLYRLNQIKEFTAPQKDAIAAVTAVYTTSFDLWFVDPYSLRLNDTVLDSSRYKSVELGVMHGTIADLLGTPGTDTVATTMDCYIERIKGTLPDKAKPLFYQEVGNVVPVNPTAATFMDLERANDLAYKRILLGSDNSATLGTPFSGTPASSVLTDLSVETNRNFPFRTVLADVLNRTNKQDYQLEAVITGRYYIDFMKDGSLKSALYSGQYSKLRVNWTNGTLSSSQISGIYESIRELKPVSVQ